MEAPVMRDPYPPEYIERWAIYSLAAYNRMTGILDTSVNIVYVHAPPIDDPGDDAGFTLQIRDMLQGIAKTTYPPDQGWLGHATTHAFLIDTAFNRWVEGVHAAKSAK